MAKTRSRRGARRNLTRRGGGKGTMHLEKSKAQHSVKAKSIKHGAKPHTKRPLTKRELISFIERRLEELEETHPEPYVTEEEVKEAEKAAAIREEMEGLFSGLSLGSKAKGNHKSELEHMEIEE
jgi:hypothetical protein